MNVIFFDGVEAENLRPLTLNKPLAELRMGIFTFKERWEKLIPGNYSYLTADYLSEKYSLQTEKINLFLNPAYFPNGLLTTSILRLKDGESIWQHGSLIAGKFSLEDFQNSDSIQNRHEFEGGIIRIRHLWDLFTFNPYALKVDFDKLIEGRASQRISPTNGVFNAKNIFIEEGAEVEYSILNAKEGPIYIGKNAEVMEGCMVRGSLALCEGAKLTMGAKIYSGTTIGPHCKVGGEVNNSILMGYSNKGHEGFLGNSVIGEWCNLGADTNNSNLKNNYSGIKIWNYPTKSYLDTGLQFCGLMMGDFSKSAIATRFNTGTVVGVSANVFSDGFPPKFIPSFSWGGEENSERFDLERSYDAASKMMERRKKILTDLDKEILKHIFSEISEY
jgi:UDP-N-acetylglucosamine diphosphorylase/glucosamine-1-phosphate N-acetyltransferase